MCEPTCLQNRRIIFSQRTLNLTSMCVCVPRHCFVAKKWLLTAVNRDLRCLKCWFWCQEAKRQNWGISVHSDWVLMKRVQGFWSKQLKLQKAFLLIDINWIKIFLSHRLKRNMKITFLFPSDIFPHSLQFFPHFFLDYFSFFLPFHHFN